MTPSHDPQDKSYWLRRFSDPLVNWRWEAETVVRTFGDGRGLIQYPDGTTRLFSR